MSYRLICCHQGLLLILYLTWSLPICHSPHTPSVSLSFQLLVLYVGSIRIWRLSLPFGIVLSFCVNPPLPFPPRLLSLSDREIQIGYTEKIVHPERSEAVGWVAQRSYSLHSWRFSELDPIRPSATQSDFGVGPSVRRGWATWPPEVPSNLDYFMVQFNTQFLFWFSHGAVRVTNSSLPVGVTLIHTSIEQERPPEGQWSYGALYSYGIKIKM